MKVTAWKDNRLIEGEIVLDGSRYYVVNVEVDGEPTEDETWDDLLIDRFFEQTAYELESDNGTEPHSI